MGTAIDIFHPVRSEMGGVVKVDSGSGHSMLLQKDSERTNVWLTGRNENGQLGNKGVRGQVQSVAAKRLAWYKYDTEATDKCEVEDIATGSNHSMFLAKC